VERITINGERFAIGETGRFAAAMGWEPGIQILGARVESTNGERAVDGRAFQAGPTHAPDDWISGAIRMEIDGEILDDDEEDPDDIAGLLELALEDPSLIEPLIGVPVETDAAIFTPTDVSLGRARIDLVPGDGGLDAVVSMDGIAMDLDVGGVGLYSWVETTGTASATSVDAAISMTIESSEGTVRADLTEIAIVLDGFAITVEWVPDFMEDSIAGWIEDYVEQAIADLIEAEVVSLVEETLSAFAIGATFNDDLDMELRLADLTVVPTGLRFEVDARIQALNSRELPRNAGSLKTAGDPPEWPAYKTQPLWAAVDDDLVNQLGFAFWATDLAQGIEMDGILLGGLAGGPLPAPLGPATTVTMSLNLPPVLSPSKDEDWAAQLTVGEWDLAFNRLDGEVLRFSINLRSHVNVSMEEGSVIRMSVDDRPAQIEQAIGVLAFPDELDPGDLAALVKLLVPPLMGNASEFAPDIPIPQVALEEFIDVEATRGKVLMVENAQVRLENDSWLLLQADLAVH
jgi:hypothetical protein